MASTALAEARMDQFKAEHDRYQAQVSIWRKRRCLLHLSGMGSKTEATEFETACCAKLSHPYPVKFLWMPSKKAGCKHRGRVAVGFDHPSQREAAVADLVRWNWKNHLIQIEGVSLKKVIAPSTVEPSAKSHL